MRGALAFSLVVVTACRGAHPSAPTAHATPDVAAANPVAIAVMAQGVQAAKEGNGDLAASRLGAAIQLDPRLWEARYDLGVVLAAAGDLAGAEQHLADAAKLAGESHVAALALGEVRRRRGEHKLAAAGLADFVRAYPNAVDVRTLYVAALRDDGQTDAAIAEAREVLQRRPGDATALAELALSHLQRGDKATAELLTKNALAANPTSAVAHRALGLLELANGDDASAFAEFRKAAQGDPHDTTSRLNMGVVLLHAGAYARTEEQYREIVKVSENDVAAQLGLAAALRGQSDAQHRQKLEEARALLERVLASDPHNTSALFNIGVLSADFMKAPAEGASYFERFLADAPSDHPLRAEAQRYVSAASATGPSPPEGRLGGTPKK